MNSHVTADFRECFARLHERMQRLARKNYELWKQNPRHPGLDFKRVSKTDRTYSIRVGIGWRALGWREGDTVVWFWIGSHADYDALLRQLGS